MIINFTDIDQFVTAIYPWAALIFVSEVIINGFVILGVPLLAIGLLMAFVGMHVTHWFLETFLSLSFSLDTVWHMIVIVSAVQILVRPATSLSKLISEKTKEHNENKKHTTHF